MKKILIVGAGFSGAVLARELAESGGYSCTVIDSRDHVAGNCHTERDVKTGVMEHKYGPHIFHTSREDVWEYIQKFGKFEPFTNRVKASVKRGVFSLPINLHTINQFFGKNMSPSEAKEFMKTVGDPSIEEPQNFEEQALKMLGKDLYESFFKGYTIKQWGCDPKELPASILKRLPVRFDYNDNYYNSKYQGIPRDGYTSAVSSMLDHDNISVKTSTNWEASMAKDFDHVVYTGPLDEFFDCSEGKLGYRTVFWSKEYHTGDFQGNAVINYPEVDCKHTRIHEHKHFAPWEEHDETIVFTEYSKETESGDIPYYPKRLEADKSILDAYMAKANALEGVSFLGRLATYRYMDMHQIIGEALDYSKQFIDCENKGSKPPAFPTF